MELKFAAPLEVPFAMKSLFGEIEVFSFWPKTMDYSKV